MCGSVGDAIPLTNDRDPTTFFRAQMKYSDSIRGEMNEICILVTLLLSRRALTVEIELHYMSGTDSSSQLSRKMITDPGLLTGCGVNE